MNFLGQKISLRRILGMIAGVVVLHIWALHVVGQNNPTGVEPKSKADTVPFTPYDLPGYADRAAPARTDEDLLFDVLIRFGVDPAERIVRDRLAGHAVFIAGDLLACLTADPPYTPELFAEAARRRPARMVVRDAGFAGDELRINAERLLGPGIDLWVL